MGGDVRWTAAATTMDGSGVIAMDSSSGNRQRWHNRPQDGKAIAMGDGTAVGQWRDGRHNGRWTIASG